RVAAVCRGERAVHLRVPLPARDEQVEQDRAPDVLPHHGELAWSAVGEPGGGGQPDWDNDDKDGVDDSVGIGREHLSNRSRGHGAADGEPGHQARQVPRRMALYHPAKDMNGQFILASRLTPPRGSIAPPRWWRRIISKSARS